MKHSSQIRKRQFLTPGIDRLHAAFNFKILENPWKAQNFARSITQWDDLNQGDHWPNNVLNNHDQPRTTTRYKFDDEDRLAKTAATLILTLRGTPFLYYGEEIGMRDIKLSRSEILDPPGKKYWPFYKGRDGCRSPMQWNTNSYSGFSNFKPWLPIHPGYVQRNVEKQQQDPKSLLNFYKELIKLRKATPALQNGSFRLIPGLPSSILCYIREMESFQSINPIEFSIKTITLYSTG